MRKLLWLVVLVIVAGCTTVPEVPHAVTGIISDTSHPDIRVVKVEGRGDGRDMAIIDAQMVAIAAVVRRTLPSKDWSTFENQAKQFYKQYQRFIRKKNEPLRMWVDSDYTYVKMEVSVDQQALNRVLEDLGFILEREKVVSASVVVVPEKEVIKQFKIQEVRQSIAVIGEMLAERDFDMVDYFQSEENQKLFNSYWDNSGRQDDSDLAAAFAQKFGADVYIKYGVSFEEDGSFTKAAVSLKAVVVTTSKLIAQTTGYSEKVTSKSLAMTQALRNAIGNSIDQISKKWRKQTENGVPYLLTFKGNIKKAASAVRKTVKKVFTKTKQIRKTSGEMVYVGFYKGDRDEIVDLLRDNLRSPWKLEADIEVGSRFELKITR